MRFPICWCESILCILYYKFINILGVPPIKYDSERALTENNFILLGKVFNLLSVAWFTKLKIIVVLDNYLFFFINDIKFNDKI